PAGDDLRQVLDRLSFKPKVLSFSPTSLAGVDENLRQLGNATGTDAEAEALIARGRERMARVRNTVRRSLHRPRVFCLEWVDPYYTSGHWVPEMVEIAGGIETLTRPGLASKQVVAEEIIKADPEVLVVMPCGFSAQKAFVQAHAFIASETCS